MILLFIIIGFCLIATFIYLKYDKWFYKLCDRKERKLMVKEKELHLQNIIRQMKREDHAAYILAERAQSLDLAKILADSHIAYDEQQLKKMEQNMRLELLRLDKLDNIADENFAKNLLINTSSKLENMNSNIGSISGKF